jgi:hypothetical protein
MRKIPGTEPEDKTFKELRTNIQTGRATAGLGAYSWTASITDGVVIDIDDVLELRTAIDDAYDEILICSTHYVADDAVHYTTDKTSHDSADDATHYATDNASNYSSDDATHDTTHYTTRYTTHDSTNYGTHLSTAYTVRKSSYLISAK